MAYNMKNILVNLSKTAGSGGGGDSGLVSRVEALENSFTVLAGIVDSLTANMQAMRVYSTEGQVIGTWNNKPVIRKVYVFDTPLTANYNNWTNTNISNAEMDVILGFRGVSDTGGCNEMIVSNTQSTIEILTGRNGANYIIKYAIIDYVEKEV